MREDTDGVLTLGFSGDLNSVTVARLWAPVLARVRGSAAAQTGGRIRVELAQAGYIDGAGLALLVKLRAEAEARGAQVELLGLSVNQEHLLSLAGQAEREACQKPSNRRGLKVMMSRGVADVLANIVEVVSFTGECSLAVWESLRHPERVRWKNVLLSALAVGVESMPILLLIGFLMGLIMSFQSVITLQRFGGEIYVPNMLGLVMFREMGPLVTAILLAARSGSAFAAEIGTMRVNEELDAMTTMGISPVRFLVGPRILSSLAMVPLMTLFFNFASLVGGALVMLSIGFPLVTFTSRVFANVKGTDLVGSLVKILVFSLLVAGVSCLRGLRTGGGASAVGRSTTSAVVSGLILITIADGLFAVLFYYLKI
ncbi:MAG: ABC transporter permease [Proteobacteria bacterium]|nr:ABC transporter permease [Pseudomonadota bacterium]MBU1594367.1 ABC transporter permease [Pseudomonadota bacterium]